MESYIHVQTKQDNTLKDGTKGLPYFVIINKSNKKEVKIPCANEDVAKKVLGTFRTNS